MNLNQLNIIFITTQAEIEKAKLIKERMLASGLDLNWVAQFLYLANRDQGVFNLMELWDNETDPVERDLTIEELKKSVHDYDKLVKQSKS